ncbi:helix-turn-helix domain-containing protein [Alkalicoccus luteus]|uniref:Helix-turn-helix transcriptional regulator n=1 Tax=Alkalicoccus luteus TaxID=1237094 RepID=A0A969PVR3_9BACI|nr:helix-turn-helix transcriptional regulator [Alkalicoccus luteus]
MKNRIKVYRAMHDITQAELAKQVNVSRQTIVSIEKERHSLSLELAYRIANYFQADITDVFPNPGNDDLEDKNGSFFSAF